MEQQPGRESSTVWKGVKLAFGGCVVLPILLVVAGVAFTGLLGSSGGDGSGGGSGGSSGGGNNETPTAGIGQTLTVGEAEWVVQDASQTEVLQSQFGPAGSDKQGNFVIVDFTFTNNTGEAVTLDPVNMTLLDAEGREFESDTDTFEYVPVEKDIFLEQVNPGVSREGRIIFTVAPDASDFTLEVGGAGFLSSEKGRVNLG